jgi:hypothetical protein
MSFAFEIRDRFKKSNLAYSLVRTQIIEKQNRWLATTTTQRSRDQFLKVATEDRRANTTSAQRVQAQ